MILEHDEFDRRLADVESLDALDPDAIRHAEQCVRCRTRLELSHRIRATAPTLVEPDRDDNITDAVLARTHRTASRLPQLLAAAAAVVLVAGTASVILRSPDGPPDVLADIADDYTNSEAIRFVYATEASIDISEQFDLDQPEPAETRALSTQIPTCTDTTPASDIDRPQPGVDLGPIVEAIASNDPCLALQLIDESAQPAQDAFNTLASSIQQRQAGIDRLPDDDVADSDLVSASVDAFIEDQRDQIEVAREALNNLDRSFTTLAETVQPLSSTNTGDYSTSAIETGLTALRADTTAATQIVTAVDPEIAWTQITTGTWSPDGIEIEGITERDGLAEEYTTVADDPLGLASTVLDRPQILVDLLESAPPSTENRIEWAVPAGVLESDLEWTATARLDNGRLQDIQLRSPDATITLSPQR